MDFVGMIKSLAQVAAGWLGFQSKKLDLRNSAPMQQAAVAQQEAKAGDQVKQAIANKDTEEIRRELAE